MHARSDRAREGGTALVLVLILLGILSLLSSSGMRTATVELAMARNARFAQAAFEAAEAGIALVLAEEAYALHAPTAIERSALGQAQASVTAVATFLGTTPVPRAGFSLGEDVGDFAAYHFEITSTGTAPRNATAVHRAGFYVIGPGGGP